MNRDDVIRMAREAGFEWNSPHDESDFAEVAGRFANLVAAAEREACEKVCDDLWQEDGTAFDCREAIRARGQS